METESKKNSVSKRKKNDKKNKSNPIKGIIFITIWTFFLAIGMSFISENILKNVNIIVAFFILIFIILTGILFDIIGIAVAASIEKPFHAMASKKIHGAKFAVKLVRNAGLVSSFCNDVIGDVCGIVSGAAATIIILQFNKIISMNLSYLSVVLSAFVAAFTVGGKAFGKQIALKKSKEIVFYVGKVLYYMNHKLGIDFLPKKSKK
ncbi:hypothetical protein [Inediibacterium massiliense]|uniref:hypothetical protein n=1 Tax=Inediibacterium massiliense TaxID=1658111 RepID=UPI000AE1C3D6|nr:hypothetical protein [Inediibacterium massiliense]